MKTKEQVLNIIKDLLEDNNTIVTASLGNGGAGLTNIMCNQNTERIESFINELEEMNFDGVAETSEDIMDSDYWNDGCLAYQFSDEKGFSIQIMIEGTFDVHFNNESSSNSKGFKESFYSCKDYINSNNGTNESYFQDYKGGTVSVVCNETGETVFEVEVK